MKLTGIVKIAFEQTKMITNMTLGSKRQLLHIVLMFKEAHNSIEIKKRMPPPSAVAVILLKSFVVPTANITAIVEATVTANSTIGRVWMLYSTV